MDEYNLSNNLDILNQLKLSDKLMLEEVDNIVNEVVLTGDVRPAVVYGNSLRRGLQVYGVTLAKLLYKLFQNWNTIQSSGLESDFWEFAYAELGLSKVTSTKYVAMWQSLFENEHVPPEIKVKLLNQPIKSLLLLTAVARENTNQVDWEQVANVATVSDMRRIVRNIRGDVTSSGKAIHLMLNTADGSIIVKQNNESQIIGFLLVDKTDPLIVAGIQKIIRTAQILEI